MRVAAFSAGSTDPEDIGIWVGICVGTIGILYCAVRCIRSSCLSRLDEKKPLLDTGNRERSHSYSIFEATIDEEIANHMQVTSPVNLDAFSPRPTETAEEARLRKIEEERKKRAVDEYVKQHFHLADKQPILSPPALPDL